MTEEPGSLLVFGYACKLFRDDEKASSIDAGQHLIPWMGDPQLRIDRYDGRGALHNLEDHVPAPGNGHRVDPTEGLSDVEKVEEELCEEERYRSLKHDDSEDVLKAEEAKKRQQVASSFSQVGFSYDTQPEQPAAVQGQEFGPTNTHSEEDLTPFTPTPEMNIPENMVLPPTNKLFSVIAKTAKFLAGQGAQMEILLKAKQSNNPAFQFLNLDSPLNAFYKHLVRMIKSRQFIPQLGVDKPEQQEARPYGALSLVPQYSNFSSSEVHIAPKIPTIKYKKDEDCSYSKLISLMKQKASSVPPVPPPPPTCPVVPPPAPPLQFPPHQVTPPPPSSQIGFLSVQPGETVPPPETKEKDPPILIPPPELQTIVDKMASYVSKHGRGFEEVVKSRSNPKFTFLNPSDKHHQYYLHKLNVYTTGNYDPQLNSEPLTFKVKKSVVKEEPNLNSSNALPYEASDSGEENEDKMSAKEPIQAKPSSGFPVLKGFLPTGSFHVKAEPELYTTAANVADEATEKLKEEDRVRLENNKKVRDRLAAATREKMIQVSREKALQLERKRKAAQFLAQLAEKRTMVSSVEPIEVEDDDEEDEEGEIKEVGREEMTFGVADDKEETISAVNIWPPPPPPQLVIPKLSTPQPPLSAKSSRDASPEDESSESESSSRHSRSKSRKHKRRRSRSRSREKRKRRKPSRSRSRSRHKKRRKHKKSSRHKKSSKSKRDRDYSSRSDSSDNEEPRRKKEREEKVNDEDSTKESTAPTSPETSRSDHIDNGTQPPAFSKITEDLRAKVRAMLATKKSTNT